MASPQKDDPRMCEARSARVPASTTTPSPKAVWGAEPLVPSPPPLLLLLSLLLPHAMLAANTAVAAPAVVNAERLDKRCDEGVVPTKAVTEQDADVTSLRQEPNGVTRWTCATTE